MSTNSVSLRVGLATYFLASAGVGKCSSSAILRVVPAAFTSAPNTWVAAIPTPPFLRYRRSSQARRRRAAACVPLCASYSDDSIPSCGPHHKLRGREPRSSGGKLPHRSLAVLGKGRASFDYRSALRIGLGQNQR